MTIRNPVVWGWDQVKDAALVVGAAGREDRLALDIADPAVRRLSLGDLRYALARGFADFSAEPTHYVFACAVYPLLGLVFARLAFGYDVVQLIFPLAAGFALLGPVAAVGIYELSRRREQGLDPVWWDAFAVFRSPSIGAIVKVALTLTALFVIWMVVAEGIYRVTVGLRAPATAGAFFHDVFATGAGWALIVVGNGVGFLFALLALMIGTFSFPMILDQGVSAETAIRASVRAVVTNPRTMAAWGLIVAVLLALGSIPLLLGLVVVVPVLGHSTWHLYRRAVRRLTF